MCQGIAYPSEQVAVAVIGGGICGVMAGARCVRDGISFVIIERGDRFGGNWVVRANSYSHLQAYAALYQWDNDYALDKDPFKKVPGRTVLDTIARFATRHKLQDHTRFSTEVFTVERRAHDSFDIHCRSAQTGASSTVTAASVLVVSGILGEQYSPSARQLPNTEAFTGLVTYAGRHQGTECILGDETRVVHKDVVILGTGAFALEAMEAAHRARARSITLITRPRDRWIMPYSQQFKFVFLATCPFCPRWLACWAVNSWMAGLYKSCGIAFMGPAPGSDHSFTGQCNDAFFQLAKKRRVTYIIDKVESFKGHVISLRSGKTLHADILVNAQGCEVVWQPPYLRELGVDLEKDLHNFAFLGRSPRIGTASDWVWYNVPHGPQKQLESFFQGQRCIREGKEREFEAALEATPFSGCKGESLVPTNPSGLMARAAAYRRSLTAGRSVVGKALTIANIELQELGTWLLCGLMYALEAVALRDWLQGPGSRSWLPHIAK